MTKFTVTDMDPAKKKLSGYANKRKALEKKAKEENLVKQTPKIHSFFNKKNDEASTSTKTRFNNLAEITAEEVSKI